jgi:hypothetical protein
VICKEFAIDRFLPSSIVVMTEDQTHGFELVNDGIHRSVISVEAIESLIEALVESDENKKPSLWHWVYNPSVDCYFPTCILCNKLVCDAHLVSKDHKAIAKGSDGVFEFPRREFYCTSGVQFFPRGNPSQQNSSPTLRYDYPLPEGS